MDSQQIASYRPLPPQRWGFLPTDEFWQYAALTPISLVFWAGAAVGFSLGFFTLVWWQQALVWSVFWWGWAGLIERYSRKYLARQRMRALTEAAPSPASETSPASTVSPPPTSTVSPSPATSRWALVARAESWDLVARRLFGRGAGFARFVFEFSVGLSIFYPSWVVKLMGILALTGAAFVVGSWERRQVLPADARNRLERAGRG